MILRTKFTSKFSWPFFFLVLMGAALAASSRAQTPTVVVGRKLRFDSRHRKKTADADVETLLHRKVQVGILKNRVESVSPILLQQLLAEVVLRSRKAIVDAEESSDVIAKVEVFVLNSIGQAFDINDRLIQLDRLRKDIVSYRKVVPFRRTHVKAGRNPSIDFRSLILQLERSHQWVDIAIRHPEQGRAAIAPV